MAAAAVILLLLDKYAAWLAFLGSGTSSSSFHGEKECETVDGVR